MTAHHFSDDADEVDERGRGAGARDCDHPQNLEHREGVKFVEDAVERLALAVPLNWSPLTMCPGPKKNPAEAGLSFGIANYVGETTRVAFPKALSKFLCSRSSLSAIIIRC